jgi:hypothetical protein
MSSPYDAVPCPLDGCGADLYIVHTSHIPICVGSTVEDFSEPRFAISNTWQIECTEGHVVVLAKDDRDQPFDSDPDHRDAERLAAMTGWEIQRSSVEKTHGTGSVA